MKPNSLDRIRIASPCPVDWEQMTGDERVRFCSQCNLSVYNLAELTRAEAEHLIATTEGRICARLFRRADGKVITSDCPVGLRALRRRAARLTTAAAVLLTTICANVFGFNGRRAVNKQMPVQLLSSINPGMLTATLSGAVVDPNGDPIPNATVTLTNLQTNQRLVTKSNKRGQYHLTVSQFGNYSLTVKAEYFQNFYEPVEMHLNDDLRFDITMMVSGIVGIVTIDPVRGKGFDVDGTHIRIN